jgi:hypothetical protein
MTASASPQPKERLFELTVFEARAEARAKLYAFGEIELHDAVDGLQANAVASCLVDNVGQDEVQRLIASAFEKLRA